VRLRLFVLIATISGLSLIASAGASAYPWPVKPFHKQHPIRANFGDPRTAFLGSIFDDGIAGPGTFLFHNGIDIAAPDGTRVYPVMSGVAHVVSGDEVAVDTGQERAFQYYHIAPQVSDGQTVIASKTVLGRIRKTYGHVHLSEIRGTEIWNPLARGGIAPYRDTTRPTVSDVLFREYGSLRELDPLAICGRISIVAEAHDTPPLRVDGNFANFPVSPALVMWTLRRVGTGAVVGLPTVAADFRGTLPLPEDFWNIYARGTYQNAPRFGVRQFTLMPGRFLYQLTPPTGLDTRTLPNGVYQVTARAADIKGNVGSLNQRFTVVNQAGTPTGCPPPPPHSS
jgi:murein DD-endopeptidase MepM/ murein hydrolase activator NlpD